MRSGISDMRLLWYSAPSIPNSHAPCHLGRHCSNLHSASRLALRRPAMRVHGDVRAIGVSAKLVELFTSWERWPSGVRRTLGKRVEVTPYRGFESPPLRHNLLVRPGHIGNRSYRRHRLHFWAKRVVERLQSFFLQIDVAEIVLHKADQPNTFFDFFDPQGLSCEDRAEINFFAVQTDASAVGDMNDAVVKRISKFWQAAIAADGGSVDFRGALHVQGLMRPFVVELFEKIIEFALLLQ